MWCDWWCWWSSPEAISRAEAPRPRLPLRASLHRREELLDPGTGHPPPVSSHRTRHTITSTTPSPSFSSYTSQRRDCIEDVYIAPADEQSSHSNGPFEGRQKLSAPSYLRTTPLITKRSLPLYTANEKALSPKSKTYHFRLSSHRSLRQTV